MPCFHRLRRRSLWVAGTRPRLAQPRKMCPPQTRHRRARRLASSCRWAIRLKRRGAQQARDCLRILRQAWQRRMRPAAESFFSSWTSRGWWWPCEVGPASAFDARRTIMEFLGPHADTAHALAMFVINEPLLVGANRRRIWARSGVSCINEETLGWRRIEAAVRRGKRDMPGVWRSGARVQVERREFCIVHFDDGGVCDRRTRVDGAATSSDQHRSNDGHWPHTPRARTHLRRIPALSTCANATSRDSMAQPNRSGRMIASRIT